MKVYYVQVFVMNHHGEYEWRRLRTSEGKIYTFESRGEADRVKRRCYPVPIDEFARVEETEAEGNETL